MSVLSRRAFGGLALASASHGALAISPPRLFDAHFHIIDPHFPLVANEGYTPPPLALADYRAAAEPLGIAGGAVVAGSFHAFDQTWLLAALKALGPGWVGVAQVRPDIPDTEIAALAAAGVRALRFNMFRGRIDDVADLVALATRAHRVAGWHAEIYADAAALGPHVGRLTKMGVPLSIDHLGMTAAGLPVLLDLVSAEVKVKATGFGRVTMDVAAVLEAIAARDPSALMFGTDMPSTRAKRPFEVGDLALVRRVLGLELAQRVTWENARAFYRVG